MTTTTTYYIVRYDTPNGRPSRKFYDTDAYMQAYRFYQQQKASDKNPEMMEVTERRIK